MEIERHPWPPFIPDGARLLIMGTFPPGSHRWSMDFFYPNPINDFWRIMGDIYFGNPAELYFPERKTFDLDRIKTLLRDHHIAMGDTGLEVRRLKGNASDKFLEIVTPMPLEKILRDNPTITSVATTGEKAAGVVAGITSTEVPRMGECIETRFADRNLLIFRMPSTSRAYPMKLGVKAAHYRGMLLRAGCLDE